MCVDMYVELFNEYRYPVSMLVLWPDLRPDAVGALA